MLFDPPMRARVVGFPVRVRRLRVAVDDPDGPRERPRRRSSLESPHPHVRLGGSSPSCSARVAAYARPRGAAAPSPRGERASAPIAQTLGFGPIEVEKGRVDVHGRAGRVPLQPDRRRAWWASRLALLDSAMGCAVHSTLDVGVAYTTLEVKANFVRPLTADTGPVRCTATVVHGGGPSQPRKGGSSTRAASSMRTERARC